MLEQQPSQANSAQDVVPQPDRFTALCAELEDYAYLPELTPGHPAQLITGDHVETLDASILAGLTLP